MDNWVNKSNTELIALLQEQAQTIALLLQNIQALEQEIARLKGQKSEASKPKPELPTWFKPSKPDPPAKIKKQRKDAFVRPRETPTQEIVYACSHCPDCGRTLAGGSEYSRRQVIELPEIKVQITDHVLVSRYCGVCQKSCRPEVDLSEETVGRSRFGQQIHAFIAYLRQVGRLPIRTISLLLSGFCHLKISDGEVVGMLSSVATLGKTTYDSLQAILRASPFVHGDETGWRENGQNGYLWSFSTPSVCYFTYPKSRSGQIVMEVLGEKYKGVVVSDFYGGYNSHLGFHQRCWVHLLRDVHELTRKFPTDGVMNWAKQLRELYDRAKACGCPLFQSDDPHEREDRAFGFQSELVSLVRGYKGTGLPQSVLCERLLRFANQMFSFVWCVGCPSENNAAERSIRPRVIARKISGGTRSEAGSATMAILSSLFTTWQLQGKEGLSACRQMLVEAQRKPVVA